MKEILAVIRPQKLPRLREVLRAIPGFPGMTITKVAGCGATARHTPHSIKEVLTDFTDKVRIATEKSARPSGDIQPTAPQ